VDSLISYDGTRLAYHEKGDGPPLVCVPGGPARASAYLGDLDGLSRYRRLILLDNRGTGDSEVPADPATYRCDRLVDDSEVLRAHLGLETFDLLGHSASGSVCLLYAAKYPQRLRRLVLVTPGVQTTGLTLDEEAFMAAVRSRQGEPWYDVAYAAFERWDSGEETPENRLAAAPFFYGSWTLEAAAHAAADAEQRSPEAAAGFRAEGWYGDPGATRASLAELPAPALVVGGALDPAPSPGMLDDLTQLFRDGRKVILPDCGHFPWVDDADAFVATVNRFLAE